MGRHVRRHAIATSHSPTQAWWAIGPAIRRSTISLTAPNVASLVLVLIQPEARAIIATGRTMHVAILICCMGRRGWWCAVAMGGSYRMETSVVLSVELLGARYMLAIAAAIMMNS